MNELSIVVPCVSSVDMLPAFIGDLATQLMSSPRDADVIIVVNENAPSLNEVINFIRKEYPWLKFEILQRAGDARNWGALARFGVAYSTSKYVVLVSPYGEDDISLISSMLGKIRKGAQLVQATRYANIDDAKRITLPFKIYQSLYRAMARLCLGFNISDTTYGFKMFDRVFMQALGLSHNGYSLSPEITFKTLLSGGKVEYVSSRFTSINREFNIYKEGFGYLWLLVRGFLHRIGILWF